MEDWIGLKGVSKLVCHSCLSCLSPFLAATLSLIYSFRHVLLGHHFWRSPVIKALTYIRRRYYMHLLLHIMSSVIVIMYFSYNSLLRIKLLIGFWLSICLFTRSYLIFKVSCMYWGHITALQVFLRYMLLFRKRKMVS